MQKKVLAIYYSNPAGQLKDILNCFLRTVD